MTNRNDVTISGTLDPLTYSHEVAGEAFYRTMIHSTRFSGINDDIPVVISERTRPRIKPEEEYLLHARICSRDEKTNGKTKLRLSLLADSIVPVRGHACCNTIELEGYICKGPFFRVTKLGKEICQMVVATNHKDKAYYIPCVAFGKTADWIQDMNVGDMIRLTGRTQSRNYLTSDFKEGTTYEVAINAIRKI